MGMIMVMIMIMMMKYFSLRTRDIESSLHCGLLLGRRPVCFMFIGRMLAADDLMCFNEKDL